MFSITIRWGSNSIPENERSVTTAEFKTQGEALAYMQGIDDMDGWADYEVIEDPFEPADLKDVPITP